MNDEEKPFQKIYIVIPEGTNNFNRRRKIRVMVEGKQLPIHEIDFTQSDRGFRLDMRIGEMFYTVVTEEQYEQIELERHKIKT